MSEMMWGGRFQKAEEKSALDFNASVSYDCRMYKEDIAGSLAHASMLADRGIISKEDLEKITGGLLKIKKEIDEGRFAFSVELEDVHMNVEKRLTDDIGDAGARLHTARSRNDQCAADLHMYMRRHIAKLAEKLIAAEEALIGVSEKYKDVILPGYTHMQRAQPVLFAHHMMAYCKETLKGSPAAMKWQMFRLWAPALWRGRLIPPCRRKRRRNFTFQNVMETVWTQFPIVTTFSSFFPSHPFA